MTNLTRLRRRLKRRGWTQDRLAAELGVHRTYIVHFFAGRRDPAWLREALEALALTDPVIEPVRKAS